MEDRAPRKINGDELRRRRRGAISGHGAAEPQRPHRHRRRGRLHRRRSRRSRGLAVATTRGGEEEEEGDRGYEVETRRFHFASVRNHEQRFG